MDAEDQRLLSRMHELAVVDSIAGVSAASQAVTAITTVQNQIDVVSRARASAGGLQSRLENTRSGLLTYEDSIRAAESKIRDVDAARESSELVKHQVLTQVGNARLAQANPLPASVLQLLG